MSGRIFQNVVLQIKEATDRVIGVIDAEGTVISCSDLGLIGRKWPEYVGVLNRADGAMVAMDGRTFHALSGLGSRFDYAVFTVGEDEIGRTVCAMASVALNGAKSYYEEKHDRGSFIKNIISDNIMLSDIYMRAKELHVAPEVPRGVFLVRQAESGAAALIDVIQGLFPDRQNDFVLNVGDSDVALIHQLPELGADKEVARVTALLEEALLTNSEHHIVIGIGTVALHLRELARSYKEAQIAIEVGKVFDTEKYIINYENLDQETLFTIHKFFENNLNVSETARKLFVHRNTLVYRLEKIKKLTGLDLREFDDAITFKFALMVKKYLMSRGIDS